MGAALLWLAADLVPWIMGAAGTTAGLLAFGIERVHRSRAENLAAASEELIVELRRAVRLRDEQAAVAGDVAALDRHLAAAARQGLRPTWGEGVTNNPEWS